MGKEKKRIPDYARRDVAGIYYSQMKLWQGISFILAVAVVMTVYLGFFSAKHHYFLTDGVEIIRLKETSPKVEAFITTALKNMFSISYLNFDRDVSKMSFFLTENSFRSIKKGLTAMKPIFYEGKLIWIPSAPEVYVKKENGRLFFTAKMTVKEVIVSQNKEGIKSVSVTGTVVKGTPSGENLYPYRLTELKVKFGGK